MIKVVFKDKEGEYNKFDLKTISSRFIDDQLNFSIIYLPEITEQAFFDIKNISALMFYLEDQITEYSEYESAWLKLYDDLKCDDRFKFYSNAKALRYIVEKAFEYKKS